MRIARRIAIASLVLTSASTVAWSADDPKSAAIEIAMSIGQLQALAVICAAPAWSYEAQLASAQSAMPGIYTHAGLDPSEAGGDITAGRNAETSRRDDPAWPLDCNRFRHQVSYVEARIAAANGQSAAPLAPTDPSDWRSHPAGPAATAAAIAPPPPSIQPEPEADDTYKNDIP